MSTMFNECTVGNGGPKGVVRGTKIPRIAAALRDAVMWPARVFAARRELDMLANMNDVELKDIGLTRSDISDATALPSATSPSRFLAGRIEERFPVGVRGGRR